MKGKVTDKETIARLLEKFMAGDTTLAEERLLADYFAGGDVPAEWEAYKVMFGYFAAGMPVGEHMKKPKRTTLRVLCAAAAACAAVALLLLLPWAGRMAEHEVRPTVAAGVANETFAGRQCSSGIAEADSLKVDKPGTLRSPHKVARPVKKVSRRVGHSVAPPMQLAAADNAAMRRADSLAEVELREVARQQALALELIEVFGAIQAEAADMALASVGDAGYDEEVVY